MDLFYETCKRHVVLVEVVGTSYEEGGIWSLELHACLGYGYLYVVIVTAES